MANGKGSVRDKERNMDTQSLVVGSRITHGAHGSGSVTFVGTDYLGINFDGSGEALIRRETLEKDVPSPPPAPPATSEPLPWPASTLMWRAMTHSITWVRIGSHSLKIPRN